MVKPPRKYTFADLQRLPDFIDTELFDGVMVGRAEGITLIIDEDVFGSSPSEENPITYRVSIAKEE